MEKNTVTRTTSDRREIERRQENIPVDTDRRKLKDRRSGIDRRLKST